MLIVELGAIVLHAAAEAKLWVRANRAQVRLLRRTRVPRHDQLDHPNFGSDLGVNLRDKIAD